MSLQRFIIQEWSYQSCNSKVFGDIALTLKLLSDSQEVLKTQTGQMISKKSESHAFILVQDTHMHTHTLFTHTMEAVVIFRRVPGFPWRKEDQFHLPLLEA